MKKIMMLFLLVFLYSCSSETKSQKMLRESKEAVEDAAEDVKEKSEDAAEEVEEKSEEVKEKVEEGNDKEPTKKEKLKSLFKK